MSLNLNCGTKPEVRIKTWPASIIPDIQFGDEEISVKEFLGIACNFLTKTVLAKKDPRRKLIDCVRSMHIIDGYMPGAQRLSDGSLIIKGPYIGGKECISVCGYLITPADFSHAVRYVLTNTDIEGDDDIRLKFVKFVCNGKIVPELGEVRFVADIPIALSEQAPLL